MPAPTFALILPDGEIFSGYSRKQVSDWISMLPPGTRIDPPIPPGNPTALDLLDFLCDKTLTD